METLRYIFGASAVIGAGVLVRVVAALFSDAPPVCSPAEIKASVQIFGNGGLSSERKVYCQTTQEGVDASVIEYARLGNVEFMRGLERYVSRNAASEAMVQAVGNRMDPRPDAEARVNEIVERLMFKTYDEAKDVAVRLAVLQQYPTVVKTLMDHGASDTALKAEVCRLTSYGRSDLAAHVPNHEQIIAKCPSGAGVNGPAVPR